MPVKIHIKKKRLKKKKIIHTYKPTLSAQLINKQICFFNEKQIECARRIISKKSLRIGRLYILLPPKISTTKKPRGARMGKGKGKFHKFLYKVMPGVPIFKFFSISLDSCINTLLFSKKKLPNKNSINLEQL